MQFYLREMFVYVFYWSWQRQFIKWRSGDGEEHSNQARLSRRVNKRDSGMLKIPFRCLDGSGGAMLYAARSWKFTASSTYPASRTDRKMGIACLHHCLICIISLANSVPETTHANKWSYQQARISRMRIPTRIFVVKDVYFRIKHAHGLKKRRRTVSYIRSLNYFISGLIIKIFTKHCFSDNNILKEPHFCIWSRSSRNSFQSAYRWKQKKTTAN